VVLPSRPFSTLVVALWLAQMAVLAHHASLESGVGTLAADLGRYGTGAQWKGVYYRGEKIGFTVEQTVATADGFELQQDGRLQMALFGATRAARIRTSALVDKQFALESFSFSLDPGTGPVVVEGAVDELELSLAIRSPSGTRHQTMTLSEPPNLSLNLPRRLAAQGLSAGRRFTLSAFDPATLRNAPMEVAVEGREVVRAGGRPVPAFRVKTTFAGISSTSWITDVGEVVREESPTGLLTVRETRDRATALAVPGEIQSDMLKMAAIVPSGPRILDPDNVKRLRLHVEGATLRATDIDGGAQRLVEGDVEIVDAADLRPTEEDPPDARYISPEPFIESDAPEIRAEAERAAAGAKEPRLRAERLVRYVNALLEKRPTVSLPSALEVLRTKIGDCNEHTVLYVAMARALGIPARVAVGLVHVHGAFYFHAWAEVYLASPAHGGVWLPVDPTLDQFPADATHFAVGRGGLEKQASVLALLGQARIRIDSLELKSRSAVLVGHARTDVRPLEIDMPSRGGSIGCWSSPRR
jgi:transglutaminase-like putative cysteine protease